MLFVELFTSAPVLRSTVERSVCASVPDEPERTSQVTYVTMVPRVGNETLRPLGDTMGNASSVTRA